MDLKLRKLEPCSGKRRIYDVDAVCSSARTEKGYGSGNMGYVITGGCGYIGSHIVKRLLAEGNDVAVLDNLSSGYDVNKAIEFHKV